jgi:GTP-binding protein
MFIDKVNIKVTSGKGGDGAISFRHEKYDPDGGPNGGDGGKGGDIIFVSDVSLNTLGAFRYKRNFVAQSGENGLNNNKSGKDAQDLTIFVPIGTVLFDEETGRLLFDFTEDRQSYIAAEGGRGGRGNQHFATATRQAPKFAKPGDEAISRKIVLELKTIADVGLIGFPSVGKSTLLSVVTNAKPKIAAYHFTTLTPNLGIVDYKNAQEFVLADIPGLIEGASEGAGLGLDFLRHVERTRLLIHVLDAAGSEGRDPITDFKAINAELSAYSEALGKCQQIIALNKIDLISDLDELESLKTELNTLGYTQIYAISAVAREGLSELLDGVVETLASSPKSPSFFTPEEYIVHAPKVEDEYEIAVENGVYYLSGTMPKRLLKSVNLKDYESSQYFQKVLKNKGIFSALEKAGISDGDTLDIYGYQFDYYK